MTTTSDIETTMVATTSETTTGVSDSATTEPADVTANVTGATPTTIASTTTAPNGGIVGSTTTDASPEQNPLVTQAITDLAARLGVDQSEIVVVSVEEAEWPDASLGCPDPKKVYAQVLVDGYDIVLSEGGVEHHYHSGGDSAPFYCAFPTS